VPSIATSISRRINIASFWRPVPTAGISISTFWTDFVAAFSDRRQCLLFEDAPNASKIIDWFRGMNKHRAIVMDDRISSSSALLAIYLKDYFEHNGHEEITKAR
jgi:hypothetical protein